ncbi:MAG: type IV toxin-antitoxin system AbiEi family antitoxin domain-containing protein [Candidatus Symbiothrix sp.]|jgi:hypothetical protein|nr:type IV toxin-antitoxin system AbiEi family antitoxin domain-containing protein [Candidatus Symbiothrix sp.]
MDYTIENKIFKKMKQNRRGKIFFANDFAELGNYKACSKALERMAKEGDIMRVSRGIYTIPQKSELLGTLTPSFDSVVAAIVKRDRAKIIPTGLFAENALGLSTQVPIKAIYLTDGAPRKLMVGKIPLIFKKTTPKNLATKGKISGLAIQALKSIRKDRITDNEINKVVSLLKKENPQYLTHDMKLAPVWIKEIMRKAQTDNNV